MNGRPLLVIGNRNYSSWSLRPWLLAQHLGIALDIQRIVLDTPTFHAEVCRYWPGGRVPVLIHGALVIPESIAIMEYLSELADGLGWPAEQQERAHARALAAEMHAGFATLRSLCPMNIRATGRHVTSTTALARDIARINAIFSDRSHAADRGPWLFGHYSAADAMYLPVAFRLRTYGYEGLSSQAIEYVERATSDPLAATWVRDAQAETEVIEHEEVGH